MTNPFPGPKEWQDLIKTLQLKEDYAFPFFYEVFWLLIRRPTIEQPKSEWDNSPLAKWVGNGFGWAKFKIDSFK